MNEAALKRTVLYNEHAALGAKLVPFAGYEMPVQYPTGILTEHNWTRTSAGLFDVSHMGQAFLVGPDHATSAAALEKLVPADIASLKPHQIRYSQFLNPEGGILDDPRPGGRGAVAGGGCPVGVAVARAGSGGQRGPGRR